MYTQLAGISTIQAKITADNKIYAEDLIRAAAALKAVNDEIGKQMQRNEGNALGGIIGSMASGAPGLNATLSGFQQGQIDAFNSSLKDATEQSKLLHDAMENLLTPTQKFEEVQAEIIPLMDKYAAYPDVVRALQREMDSMDPSLQQLHELGAEFARDLGTELNGLIFEGKNLHDVFTDLIKDIGEMILKLTVLGPLENFLSGKPQGPSFFGSIGKLLPFADGGNPPVGQVSLVGEEGPELFVPQTAGTIIPNGKLGGLGGVTNIYQIDARGAHDDILKKLTRVIQAVAQGSVQASVAASAELSRRT